MPTLDISNFNIVVSVLGGWVSLFGLVSYLLKENFYLSEALISLLAGITFGPHALNWLRPMEYAGSEANLDDVTLVFTRLVLGVQLVLAGIQLPSRYLKKEWKPLSLLLGPIMVAMWLATGLLVWALVPHLPFLHALAIGACVTPTDPVLSNVIVKGKFADHNIPKDLQKIIIAESGANDGLGYPFLFLALYLIKYVGDGGVSESGGGGLAIGLWFGETWGYTIILSVIYGAAVGWLARQLLRYCEDHNSLQPTIDMLLNVAIFIWYGAVCPWRSFVSNTVVPISRLIPLGLLVLILRRPPFILGLHRKISQIEDIRQATFMGFFGPIGCSAIFYLYVTIKFIGTLNPGGGDAPRDDVRNLEEAVTVIVWFMVVASVVVHGLSIPVGKLGFRLPRTISRSISIERPSFQTSSLTNDSRLPRSLSRGRMARNTSWPRNTSSTQAFRIGGTVIPPREAAQDLQPPTPGPVPHVEEGRGIATESTGTEPQPATPSHLPPESDNSVSS
ncbi:hypothetical protein O1611_g741 [Lasiodiplodia mahajangana]|uniref:Uncharacterized protein n=1 Tax=Lasiodiplodia mahajangana TaxID=1108764 RepID=A0ACC2JZE9_9PEZI|nr:hypothetical protein O1611_g741 [Lasiodiplodia mahajangana]